MKNLKSLITTEEVAMLLGGRVEGLDLSTIQTEAYYPSSRSLGVVNNVPKMQVNINPSALNNFIKTGVGTVGDLVLVSQEEQDALLGLFNPNAETTNWVDKVMSTRKSTRDSYNLKKDINEKSVFETYGEEYRDSASRLNLELEPIGKEDLIRLAISDIEDSIMDQVKDFTLHDNNCTDLYRLIAKVTITHSNIYSAIKNINSTYMRYFKNDTMGQKRVPLEVKILLRAQYLEDYEERFDRVLNKFYKSLAEFELVLNELRTYEIDIVK